MQSAMKLCFRPNAYIIEEEKAAALHPKLILHVLQPTKTKPAGESYPE